MQKRIVDQSELENDLEPCNGVNGEDGEEQENWHHTEIADIKNIQSNETKSHFIIHFLRVEKKYNNAGLSNHYIG